MKVVEIVDVRKRYKSLQALKSMSLSIEQGELFDLLGPSDAGKTTLVSILAGLNRTDSDSMRVLGYDTVPDYHTARRKLDVVPQKLVFDPFLTVHKALRLQPGCFGLTKNDDWVDEVMASLNLANKVDANTHTLSGGMKRRVLVAQALVYQPSVTMPDESTAGVDVELYQALWKFISRLDREGHTIVLTTHYLEEAEPLCDRIAMLKFGEVVMLDRTANLLPQFIGLQLVLSFARGALLVLPESFRLLGDHDERGMRLHLPGYDEVEQTLSTCRLAGYEIDGVEAAKADLEDMSVQIMRRENGLPLEPQAPAIPDSILESTA